MMDFTELRETFNAIIRPDGVPTAAALSQIEEARNFGIFEQLPSISQLDDMAKSRSDPMFPDFSFEPYQYDPLPTPTSIRLVQNHGTDDDGLVQCSLKVVDLEDCPIYHCLSYTWGNPHAKGAQFPWFDECATEYGSDTTWPVSCNNKLLYVTQNLYDALHEVPKDPHFYIRYGGPDQKKTILHLAAEGGKSAEVWMAIVSGANVNSRDKSGKTPLHYAAENGHSDIVEALIRAGADVTCGDKKDRTAIFYAQQNVHVQIVQYLARIERQKEGMKPTLGPSVDGNTSFMWIDAICIDQQNTAERSQQVNLMDRIYKDAACVSVWLGRADVLTEIAVQTVSQLAPCYQNLGEGDIVPYQNNNLEVYEKAGVPYVSDLQWNALAALYLRQWFTRVWVIQEVVLNQEILVFCGRFEILFDDLCMLTEGLMRRYAVLGHPSSMKFMASPLMNQKDPSSLALDNAPHPAIHEYISAIEFLFNNLLKIAIKVRVEKVAFENRQHLQNYNTRLTLPGLMLETWSFECKDPRDKVYALLGLVNSGTDSLRVYPDYELPVERLYAQITRHIIKTKGMEILSFHNDRSISNLSTLPSWVPDYSVPGHSGIRQEFFNTAGKLSKQVYSASHTSWERLPMTGVRWDTILQTSNKNVGLNTQLRFDPSWYDMVLELDPLHTTGQHRTEVLWRTLCMDQDTHGSHPAPKIFKDQFRELISAMICAEGEKAEIAAEASKIAPSAKEMIHSPDPSIHGPYYDQLRPSLHALDELARTEPACATPTSAEIEHFRNTSDWRLWHKNDLLKEPKDPNFFRSFGTKYARRRLFRTARNSLGLSSSSVESRDEIWILAGSRVPFVLRPVDKGSYQLVSAAYVHGIMHGEAVRGNDISVEQIELE